jgi:hypothetical protein
MWLRQLILTIPRLHVALHACKQVSESRLLIYRDMRRMPLLEP